MAEGPSQSWGSLISLFPGLRSCMCYGEINSKEVNTSWFITNILQGPSYYFPTRRDEKSRDKKIGMRTDGTFFRFEFQLMTLASNL